MSTFNIIQQVGSFQPGETRGHEEFPVGTDFERLVRLGATELVEGEMPSTSQPSTNHGTAIASLQTEADSQKAEIERLKGLIETLIPKGEGSLSKLSTDTLTAIMDHKEIPVPDDAKRADMAQLIVANSTDPVIEEPNTEGGGV